MLFYDDQIIRHLKKYKISAIIKLMSFKQYFVRILLLKPYFHT